MRWRGGRGKVRVLFASGFFGGMLVVSVCFCLVVGMFNNKKFFASTSLYYFQFLLLLIELFDCCIK